MIEKHTGAGLVVRGQEILLSGSSKEQAAARIIIEHLLALTKKKDINKSDVQYALTLGGERKKEEIISYLGEVVHTTNRGKQIRAKTLGQYKYIQAIKEKDIVFGIGPAGTGKTYLAVVMALKALKNKQVERIILTRPAVEAGEKLGFLPGDLQDKVDPYLRPLYDGLYDVLGLEMAQKYMERQIIEVAPLAYMRGRTLEDAFIILDEAQNTTPEQMKMFLTRIGFGSKAVITGDITQVDLPKQHQSGLLKAEAILADIDEIAFHYLTAQDVVRHPVVAKIINAYAEHGEI
ncbi:MAG: PhoH family protein [Peptococcaceae bacterium]|nr:PhoH family protein [Peptococcaceae bacterium]